MGLWYSCNFLEAFLYQVPLWNYCAFEKKHYQTSAFVQPCINSWNTPSRWGVRNQPAGAAMPFAGLVRQQLGEVDLINFSMGKAGKPGAIWSFFPWVPLCWFWMSCICPNRPAHLSRSHTQQYYLRNNEVIPLSFFWFAKASVLHTIAGSLRFCLVFLCLLQWEFCMCKERQFSH